VSEWTDFPGFSPVVAARPDFHLCPAFSRLTSIISRHFSGLGTRSLSLRGRPSATKKATDSIQPSLRQHYLLLNYCHGEECISCPSLRESRAIKSRKVIKHGNAIINPYFYCEYLQTSPALKLDWIWKSLIYVHCVLARTNNYFHHVSPINFN